MKLSLCQIIAIVCILTVGFMTVAPFVQTTEAHGKAHKYKVNVTLIKIKKCESCGHHVDVKHGPATTLTRTHKDGESHSTHATLTLFLPGPDSCSQCPTMA